MSSYNDSASRRLFQAAKQGDVAGLEAALRAGADLEAKDPEWYDGTALHWSAWSGKKNVVLKLLHAGVNVDARGVTGLSALHLSCKEGHKDISLLLMGGGAIINATNNDGWTSLMWASQEGHDDLVVCLLDDAGADAGLKDNDGFTAMHIACDNGCISVVNILAQHGADMEAKDNNGSQPIHYAALKGYDQTVSTLIHLGADVNCADNSGYTPLSIVSVKGHVDVAETLLRNGAHTNVTTHGLQATHIATEKGHLRVLEKLNEYGSDLNALTEPTQQTPLHLAVINNHKNVAEWLILNGANPYICDTDGNSAIHLALNNNNTELVSFMASKNSYLPSHGGYSTSVDYTNPKCAVCLDQRTTTVMTLPCRHAKTCQNCMDRMEANNDNQCPICRTEITQRIPIYD